MKYHKILAAMFLMPGILLSLLSPISLMVSASDTQNELISQIEEEMDVSVFYEQETERLIKCFDVNEVGYYAIGFKNNTIYVYDSLGVFQYGYRFHTEGTYGMILKENSIVIYLGRSNIAVEIDPTGKCISAEKVYFTKDIIENVMKRTHKQIGNADYYLERDIGIFDGDYSRLVRIDEKKTKVILYDVTTRGYFVGVFHYVILSIFPIVGITFIVVKAKKEQHEADGQSGELEDSK